jgi:3-hydroxybutyryl-CoA dehydrogenase
MKIILLSDESAKEELCSNGIAADTELLTVENITQFSSYRNADAFIDLLFTPDHMPYLKDLQGTIIINSVVWTLKETDAAFVRINGWPGFLGLIEAASHDEVNKRKTEEVFACFGKEVRWLADEPGFITARVVSMIINEAFFALGEGVSTREEIDTAMKLGTAYPYGPFEWADRIGAQQITNLLLALSKEEPRYLPSDLLKTAGIQL